MTGDRVQIIMGELIVIKVVEAVEEVEEEVIMGAVEGISF